MKNERTIYYHAIIRPEHVQEFTQYAWAREMIVIAKKLTKPNKILTMKVYDITGDAPLLINDHSHTMCFSKDFIWTKLKKGEEAIYLL